jgi:DNA-binding beta-propeller fold protein YncE
MPPQGGPSQAGSLPVPWQELDFGLPTGNAYYPGDLTLDAEYGLIYALARCELIPVDGADQGEGCIAVFDLEQDRVLRTVRVPSGYDGEVVLAGDIAYLAYTAGGQLYEIQRSLLSEGVGEAAQQVPLEVLAIAFDGVDTTYVTTRDAIRRLRPDPASRPLELTYSDYPVAMAATTERVYLLGYRTFRVYSSELDPIATVDLGELGPYTMALDPTGERLYLGSNGGLSAIDLETLVLAQVPIQSPDGTPLQDVLQLAFDPSGTRLLALRRLPGWFGGTEVLEIDLDAQRATSLFSTLEGQLPDFAFDPGRERLLVSSQDDHALIPIAADAARPERSVGDVRTGAEGAQAISPRLALGVAVGEVALDESGEDAGGMAAAEGRLYVSDSTGWIHVLDRESYEVLARAYGGRYISLDAVHSWLYAGDPRLPDITVFGLEPTAAGDLPVERRIPASGKPRASPSNGQVAVVNRRFLVYDGATGDPVGQWLPGIGQPLEGCLGCYYTIAREVVIDAQRGLTATITYTPWPGKPGPSESITYDPASGRAYYSLLTGGYVHYSSIGIYSDLSVLRGRSASESRGQPVLELDGLSGDLQLDPTAGRLYVAKQGTLFVLDSETLNRVGRVLTPGWRPSIVAVDGSLGRLYAPRAGKLIVWTREGGAPPQLLPPEGVSVTGTVASILPSPSYAQDTTLLATIAEQFSRSIDGGQSWERLRGGLPESDYRPYSVNAAFSPDYVGLSAVHHDRTIYAGVYLGDSHGEGVYRSTDGGETWQLASDGLYDLRVYRVVLSPHFASDRTLLAFAHTQEGEALYRSTDGGDNWRLIFRQTSVGTPPLPSVQEVLPQRSDGPRSAPLPQFRCDYQGACQRSDDGGKTWTDLSTAGVKLDRFVTYALSPQLSQDHTVYWLTQSNLYRYRQDSGTWSICTLPLFGNRDYTNGFTSLATAATGPETHDLFVGSSVGEFLRFAAAELPWEEVRPPPVAVTPVPPTPTPCGQVPAESLELDTDVLARLGCPTGSGSEVWTAFQPFERGLMFWREDNRQIYVLDQDGTWVAYEDTWSEDQPEDDPSLTPPEGLYSDALSAPIRGFGKVWREKLGAAEASIGWATAPERGYTSTAQPFVHGLVVLGEEKALYVLYDEGTWEGR